MTCNNPAILREHFLEYVANAVGVFFGHREDDGLPGERPAAIFDADVHDFFPLLAQRIAICDQHLKLGACVVDSVRVEALLDERVAIFLGKVERP